MEITLDALFTPAGQATAAVLVRQFVEVLKVAIPALDAKVSGARMAVVVSAALYLLAALGVGVSTPEGVFQAVMAWLSVSAAAIGVNAAIDHADRTIFGGAEP
jgi:hypothetical protein